MTSGLETEQALLLQPRIPHGAGHSGHPSRVGAVSGLLNGDYAGYWGRNGELCTAVVAVTGSGLVTEHFSGPGRAVCPMCVCVCVLG